MGIDSCPTSSQIEELLRGLILGSKAADFAEHIEVCASCTKRVETLAREFEAFSKQSGTTPGGTAISGPAAGNIVPNKKASMLPLDIDGDKPQTMLSLAKADESLFAAAPRQDPLKFLAPAQKPEELGRLAHYRVFKILGEGGMGIVLLAEDTLLERQVALKVIKPEYSSDTNVRQRFLREARLMAAVKSDHVVTIHQVGQELDTCFISMELLAGESLDYMIARVTRPALRETLRIIRETAQALEAAHAKGLIHRDIKPENIWLESPNGRVKLLDFGLARPHTENVRLTTSGMIMGTPAYMAPEQGRAEPVDARTDLFSLGCILYELICGELPFRGDTVWEILFALNEKNPDPISAHWPGVPPALNELAMQLLMKAPDERPQSAAEVIARLLAIEGTLSDEDNVPFTVNKISDKSAAKNRSNAGFARESMRSPAGGNMSQMIQRDAERRQVTVLVCNCNLFDTEAYFEQLDAEEQAAILQDFHSACDQAVRNFDGTIIHFNDEGLLACFGYPIAYEDAASRAASAALNLQELLMFLGDEIRHKHNLEFEPWIGIHTGNAIAKAKDEGVSLVGEARNLAVRLKEVSRPGQIVCSQSTHRLLRGRFDCARIGAHKFKSVSEPIDLFQVRAEVAGVNSVDGSSPIELSPLTGRDLEFNLLKDRWEQVKEGTGQIVTLSGEAGLGKSRLVHAIKQIVLEEDEKFGADAAGLYSGNSIQHEHHSMVIEWRCSPQFQYSGFYPVVNYFERLLNFNRDTTPEVGLDLLIRHLESCGLAQPDVVPLFASLLCLPTNDKFPSLGLAPARERLEIFRVLKQWLQAKAEKHPILFVVEDLHWMDASTVEFLGQFLSDVSRFNILTLLTFRPEFQTQWPAFKNQASLGLNRLNKRQSADLMRKKIGSDLPDVVVEQIFNRAGGVPLFIEEFTKMMQESGVLERTRTSRFKTVMSREIPATLQDLLMARLDSMDGDREIAQLASTIGREFSFELLSATSGLDDATLCANLAKLVQAEILYEKGQAPKSTYMFKHALLEDALYNAMVKSKRQQFHARIAQILESRFPQIVATQPELLAHHFTEGGMIERSLNYWLAAGLKAQEQCANLEAISHLNRGLELLNTCNECSQRDEIEMMMLMPLGSVYQAALGYAAAEVGPIFARARELCQRVGETPQLFAIMWGNWSWHLVKGDLKLAMSLADDMVTFARHVPDIGILMEAYAAPAVARFYIGDFEGCRHYCQEAISEHENLEHCRLWTLMTGQNSALHMRCYLMVALFHLGYPEQAIKLNDEMLAMAREIGHPFSLAHALHFTCWLYINCRMPEQLHAAGLEETKIANEQGFALWQSTGTFFTGAGLFLKGEVDEGISLMEKGVASFRSIGSILTLPGQLGVLAEAYLAAGRLAEARAALNEGLKMAEGNCDRSRLADIQRLNGELILLETGDQVAAEKCFHESVETACEQKSKAMALRGTTSLARLWQAQGRHEEAKAALSTVYSVYDEGFDSEDLQKARELLKIYGLP
ncbi:MAG: hypothetical protein C0507_13330 [Cyanobacteria bacterium PR.3.49]|nr:hypothetical protein [Cyanobacteria bacterium PR.3.49]